MKSYGITIISHLKIEITECIDVSHLVARTEWLKPVCCGCTYVHQCLTALLNLVLFITAICPSYRKFVFSEAMI